MKAEKTNYLPSLSVSYHRRTQHILDHCDVTLPLLILQGHAWCGDPHLDLQADYLELLELQNNTIYSKHHQLSAQLFSFKSATSVGSERLQWQTNHGVHWFSQEIHMFIWKTIHRATKLSRGTNQLNTFSSGVSSQACNRRSICGAINMCQLLNFAAAKTIHLL